MASSEANERLPEGSFIPPGGCNSNLYLDADFSNWGFLPTTGVLADYTPKIIIRSRVDKPEAWIVDHFASSSGSKLQLKANVNRDIVELGSENPWKPYKEWEDSRYRYPFGSIFPKPANGWTGSEKDDFKQAVKDHWTPLPSNEQHWEGYADHLWTLRQREKCTYWSQAKKPSNSGSGDGPESGVQGLNSRSPNHAHLMLNMQFGDLPEWEYHEVEKADSSEHKEIEPAFSMISSPPTTGDSSIINTPSTTGYSSIADIPPLPALSPSSVTTAAVESSSAHTSLSVPNRGSAGRGLPSRGGRGRGGSGRGRG